jgi:uncharacterized membrane protein YfcA
VILAFFFVALGALAIWFLIAWYRQWRRDPSTPAAAALAVGFVTNFFDTLGIGSFAPTTAAFRIWNLIRDEHIPGTLNVGHTPPVILQAFLYITWIQVDPLTLGLLIGSSVIGAWFGAGVVARLPRRAIQIGMGTALLAGATFLTLGQLQIAPAGGTAIGLTGVKLGIAIAANLLLGALATLGFGLYAPCMILISLLGMAPGVAFPVMMGSCSFLMPAAGMRFLQANAYDAPASLGLAIGGLPAVLIAAFLVKSMPLTTMRWLVIGVCLLTAALMLRAASARTVAHTAAA